MNVLEAQIELAWKIAPAADKWIAQDQNGVWWSYSEKPEMKNDRFNTSEGCFHYLFDYIVGDWHWSETLQSRESYQANKMAASECIGCRAGA